MPKRRNEDSIEFLSKRLKLLEKELKRQRGQNRNASALSSSSTSSASSSSPSSSRSSSSSRSASPSSPAPEYQDDRDAHALEGDVHVAPPAQPVAGPSHGTPVAPPAQPVAGPSHVTPVAGPSSDFPPSSGPGTIVTPTAGPSNNPLSEASVTEGVSAEVDQAALIEILGVDPTTVMNLGEEISKDVASRFQHIATSGLDKQVRKELLDKYLVPSNCKNVAAPRLNTEIKAALTESVLKRDQAIEFRQKSIAAAIASLGSILSTQLRSEEKDNNLLKQVMDTGRILCDLQHAESKARRSFTLYSLKKDFREQLSNTKIDEYLFGADLPETLKTAKAVSRSVTDIKFDMKNQKQKPTNSKVLNWKAGPAAARRQPAGPTPNQQPAAPASRQRGTSSRKSSHHRPKPSRRR